MAKGKSRKIPKRMCVSCREMKDKKALFRVLAADGSVVYDPTGKMQGRGAYICKDEACLEAAILKGKLRHHLKTEVETALLDELKQALEAEREAEAKASRKKKVVRLAADGSKTVIEDET